MIKLKIFLRNKNFVKLWVAHLLSQLSCYALLFLVIGRTFETTTSNIATGMVWVSFALPKIFLSPFVGSLVDLWDKQKTIIFTNILHWVAIYGFALTFSLNQEYLVYPLFFVYAIIAVINDPAEMAALPQIVKSKEKLPVANNVLLFTDQAALIISSVLAGILIKFISLPEAISWVAGMPLAAAFFILLLPDKQKIVKKEKISILREIEKLLSNIKEGYQFVGKQRIVIYGFLLVIFFRVLIAVSTLLLPDFAKTILKISIYDAGIMAILPLASGLAFGTYFLHKNQKRQRKWRWIGSGTLTLGILLLMIIFIDPQTVVLNRILKLIFAGLIGICLAIIYAPISSFIQEITPERLRGQTFSLLIFFTAIASIPSVFLATTLAEILGIKAFLTIISLGILFLGGVIITKGNEIITATNHRS